MHVAYLDHSNLLPFRDMEKIEKNFTSKEIVTGPGKVHLRFFASLFIQQTPIIIKCALVKTPALFSTAT